MSYFPYYDFVGLDSYGKQDQLNGAATNLLLNGIVFTVGGICLATVTFLACQALQINYAAAAIAVAIPISLSAFGILYFLTGAFVHGLTIFLSKVFEKPLSQ